MRRRSHAEHDDFRKFRDPCPARVAWIATLAAWLAPSVETHRLGLG
jgi:hypothetical protein